MVKFSDEELTPEERLLVEKWREAEKMYECGLITINEGRSFMGLKPLPKGGNQFIDQFKRNGYYSDDREEAKP
jgi:hypothetical protein